MRVDIGDGIRLWFDVEGAGLVPEAAVMREKPTLVLIHGGPGMDHSVFKPDFGQLSDICQIIYYDQRGQGRSDLGDSNGWNLGTWADDVVRLCESLEITRPIVFGNSFGGQVAMLYAARYPDHPAKLILSSTSAGGDVQRRLDMFERLGGAHARDVAAQFYGDPERRNQDEFVRVCFPLYTVNKDRMAEAGPRAIRRGEAFRHYARNERDTMNLLPDLEGIRCPTLVLVGELDPACPVGDSQEIASALATGIGRLEILPKCGHGTYRDSPVETFRIIRDFIAEP